MKERAVWIFDSNCISFGPQSWSVVYEFEDRVENIEWPISKFCFRHLGFKFFQNGFNKLYSLLGLLLPVSIDE